MKRKHIVAANWKMHGDNASVRAFSASLADIDNESVEVFYAPPAVYLPLAADVKAQTNGQWTLTAQCGHAETSGAFTGAVSMTMLKDIGCDAVLIGHSERRQYQGESNQDCAEQVKAAIDAELTPVLCVGESDVENQAGKTEQVLKTQLNAVLDELDEADLAKLVIAYEPVWAIGTGRSAKAEDAEKIHQIIRRQIADKHDKISPLICVLYGGSVKPENASDLFSKENIDGGLIGGASLELDSFHRLIQIAATINTQ